jgi:hypothetical protein
MAGVIEPPRRVGRLDLLRRWSHDTSEPVGCQKSGLAADQRQSLVGHDPEVSLRLLYLIFQQVLGVGTGHHPGRPGRDVCATPVAAARQTGTSSEREAGSACASPFREMMPSFANTLCRCHSTVRWLR